MILECREAGDVLLADAEGGNAIGDHLPYVRDDLEDRLAQRLQRAALRLFETAQAQADRPPSRTTTLASWRLGDVTVPRGRVPKLKTGAHLVRVCVCVANDGIFRDTDTAGRRRGTMARTPLLRSILRLVREHDDAERLGVTPAELRERRAEPGTRAVSFSGAAVLRVRLSSPARRRSRAPRAPRAAPVG